MLKRRKQNADEGSVSTSTKEGQGESKVNQMKDQVCDFPVADNVLISSALCFENDYQKFRKSEHTLEHDSIPLAVNSKKMSRRHSCCGDLVALRHYDHAAKQELEQQESVEYLNSNAEMKSVNDGHANNGPSTNGKHRDKATKLQDLKWSQICASLLDTNTPIQTERAETLRKAMTILERNTDKLQVRQQLLRKTNSCHDLIDRHAHYPTKSENKQHNQFRSDELATSVASPQNISKGYIETNESPSSSSSLGFDVINSLSNSLSKGVALLSLSRLRNEPGTKLDVEFPPHGRQRRRANRSVTLDNSISSTSSSTTSKDNNELTESNSSRSCKEKKSRSRRVKRIIRSISPRSPVPSVSYNVTHICTGTESNDQDTQHMRDPSVHLPSSPGNQFSEHFSSDEDQNFLNGLLFLSHNKGIEIQNLMRTSLRTNRHEQVHPKTT